MLKKLMIGSMGFLFLSSATLFSYRALEPKAATGIEESYLNAAQPSAMLRSVEPSDDAAPAVASAQPVYEPGLHNIYFCRPDNDDCAYINEYVFKPLAQELTTTALDAFEFYDLTSLGENYPAAKLKSQWGFESYPAFVSLSVADDGTQTINNVLSWNKEDPIDAQSLKLWMIDNGIWTGEIEDQGELIEQPE